MGQRGEQSGIRGKSLAEMRRRWGGAGRFHVSEFLLAAKGLAVGCGER